MANHGLRINIAMDQHYSLKHCCGSKILETVSRAVQWLRIHLAMQGTPVGFLAWEYPTYFGAAKPVCHYRAHALQLLKPMYLGPMVHKRSHCSEKPVHRS